ncbi:MAG TPA: SPFH domain-containing protein [Fimbriimonadaceae bacterium]|nr:SPFH domain-containing protein [Fimbriimonadaceae bacterium]
MGLQKMLNDLQQQQNQSMQQQPLQGFAQPNLPMGSQVGARYSMPRSSPVMIVNYLSGIIFAALMIVGYLFFGPRFQPGGDQPYLFAGVYVFFSIAISSAVKIAAQWEKALVFRFGKYVRTSGPGIYFLTPLVEQSKHVDMRIITMDIPRQEAITRDNVPVAIDAVLFMRVVKPDQAVINVQDYFQAITQFARSALRDVIGGRTLDDLLAEREAIGAQIATLTDKETEHWGLAVDGIRIQDILLPEDLKRVMSRQAAAEREKRANITKSEGDRMAAENLAAAARTMAESPGAMQLRTLQTLDGLGPTASNTVIMALPVEVMEAVEALSQFRSQKQSALVEKPKREDG